MAITDTIIKKTIEKFSGYYRTTVSTKYNAEYSGETSGTISYPDSTTFVWTSTSALDSQIDKVKTIYTSLISSATNYTEIKNLYLISIQNMQEAGTYGKDSFIDGTYQQSHRPLTADMAFLDWLDKKIVQESKRTNGTYLRIAQYV